MSGTRRLLLVVAIAALAIVPLRAFGVVGGTGGGLSVSASLGGCGVAGSEIVCQLDVSFTGVEGADYYTASVTRADGSVQNVGSVGGGEGGGGASIYVPYVGSGVYSVTVSAWGSPDEGTDGERELLDREKSGTGEDEDSGKVSAEPAEEDAGAQPEEPVDPGAETPVEPATPETQTLPQCQPETTEAAEAPAADGEAAEASAAPAAAPPAPSIECTTPSADSNGPCCPPGA